MNINYTQLRVLAAAIILESKLDKASKVQILNFVKECPVSHLKGFFLDGEVYSHLSEDAETIIEKRFKEIEPILEAGYRQFEGKIKKFLKYGIVAILGLPFGVILPMALMYLYRHLTDTCIKRCGGPQATRVCYNNCYATAAQKVVVKIQSELTKAKSISGDNEKKKAKAIAKLQSELAKWQDKVQMYKERATSAKIDT